MRISSSVFALFAYSRSVYATPVKGCNPVDSVYLLLKSSLQEKVSSVCVSILGGDKTITQTRLSHINHTSTYSIDPPQTQIATGPAVSQHLPPQTKPKPQTLKSPTSTASPKHNTSTHQTQPQHNTPSPLPPSSTSAATPNINSRPNSPLSHPPACPAHAPASLRRPQPPSSRPRHLSYQAYKPHPPLPALSSS